VGVLQSVRLLFSIIQRTPLRRAELIFRDKNLAERLYSQTNISRLFARLDIDQNVSGNIADKGKGSPLPLLMVTRMDLPFL